MAKRVANEDDVDPETYIVTEKDKEEFRQLVEKKDKKISIVCGGPYGVGKSTLLNGLLGVNTTDPNSFEVGDSLDPGTKIVTEKRFIREGVKITLWDTPGLEGDRTVDNSYLQKIKEMCGEFDFFLYCINGAESRATELFDEKSSLKKFHNIFKAKLWKRAAIILTCANVIEDDLKEEKECEEDAEFDVEMKFQEKIEEWRAKVRQQLIYNGVTEKRAGKVPVLPAGIAHRPSLPGIEFWLTNIFEKIIERMDEETQIAYLMANMDRFKPIDEMKKEEVSEQKAEDQPIGFEAKSPSTESSSAKSSSAKSSSGSSPGLGRKLGAMLYQVSEYTARKAWDTSVSAVTQVISAGKKGLKFFKKKIFGGK